MDPIEKVRNAVAHNRFVRPKLHGNYVNARNKLDEILHDALERYT